MNDRGGDDSGMTILRTRGFGITRSAGSGLKILLFIIFDCVTNQRYSEFHQGVTLLT